MSCEIFLLHGCVDKNASLVKAFQYVARMQKSGFKDIFPWETHIDNDMIMFIAATDVATLRACRKVPTKDTQICGWLTAFIQGNVVYLAEISSRSASDNRYKGIGYELFMRLVEWCKNNSKEFIYLYPLNDVVKNIYVNKWGLQEITINQNSPRNSKYLFYRLKTLPSPQEILEKERRFEITDFDIVAESMTKAQVEWMQQLKKTCPKRFGEIVDELQKLICACGEPCEASSEIDSYLKQLNLSEAS